MGKQPPQEEDMPALAPVSPRALLTALALGAIPAFLAFALDEKALQPGDITLAALVFLVAVFFIWRIPTSKPRLLPWPFALVLAAVPTLWTMATLDGPITNDERSFQFQAELFASGEIAEPLPHAQTAASAEDDLLLLDVFRRRQVYEDPATDRRFSKYAPGTALALLPGVVLGQPLVATLLAALADLLLLRWIAHQLRLQQRHLVPLLFAASPFFLLMQTSTQSEVYTLPAVLLGYGVLLRLRQSQTGSAWALVVGASCGWVFCSRPLTGFVCALVFGLALLQQSRRWPFALFAILGGLPFLLLFLWWNQEFSGDPWTPVYSLYAQKYGPFFPGPERLPQDVYGNGDFWVGLLRQSGRWSVAFGGMLGAAALAFWGAWRLRLRDGGVAILLSLLLPAVYSLHWYAGHRAYLGPLYAAESLGLLCLGFLFLLEQAPPRWGDGLVAVMVLGGLAMFANRWSLIASESHARSGPQRLVQTQLPANQKAVVFLPVKNQGSKEKAFKYWTPSLPSELQQDAPLILRTTRRMTPQKIVALLGLGEYPLYGYVPQPGLAEGGILQPLNK